MRLRIILSLFIATTALGLSPTAQAQSLLGRKLVGPDYQRPAAATTENWIDFNHPGVISAIHGVDDQQWWNVFGDAEIPKIVAVANRNNLPLQAAILRVREQSYLRAVAVGNLFPQGQEAFAEYQRQQFSENGNPFGIPGFGNTFDLFQMGFNASWEIDLWGRLRRTIEASTASVHASIEDERDLRLSLTADVISAYVEIRVYEQRIRNAREQLAAQEETLRIAASKFENGSESKLDSTQATATLEVIRSNIPGLESELRHANNKLCLLLGIPPRDLSETMGVGFIPETPDSIVVGVPVDLLRRRPDIRRAERAVAQQSALIGVAKADLYPAFSLRGTVNWQSFTFSDLFSSGSNGGAIIPGLRWDILNYGRIKNRISAQEARFCESVILYRQSVLNAHTEAENSLHGFLKKKEQVASLERAVQATRESLETGIKQYQAGTIEYDRLNDLRKELLEQLDLLAIERGKATLFLIRVYRTMGGGWAIPDPSFQFASQPMGSIIRQPGGSQLMGTQTGSDFPPHPLADQFRNRRSARHAMAANVVNRIHEMTVPGFRTATNVPLAASYFEVVDAEKEMRLISKERIASNADNVVRH